MTTAARPRTRKNHKSFLPPTADVAKIAGRDFVIMPLVDFEEWQEDQLLAAVVAERLESDEKVISFEEVEARLDRGARDRK